jgi:hypothetical protein
VSCINEFKGKRKALAINIETTALLRMSTSPQVLREWTDELLNLVPPDIL